MNHVPVSMRSPIDKRSVCVRGPDRGGQAEGAVVHQRDGLLVGLHFHDARDRAEDFLAHHRRGVDRPRAAPAARGTACRRGWRGTASSSITALPPASIEAAICARIVSAAAVRTTGPSVVACSSGLPSTYLRVRSTKPSTNAPYNALVHVDALQPATGLAAVEVRAVDDVLDRVREIRIVAHVDRIAAAELEPGADETLRRLRAARHGHRRPSP